MSNSLNPLTRQQIKGYVTGFMGALIGQTQVQWPEFYTAINADTPAYFQNGILAVQVSAGGSGYQSGTATATVDVPTGQPNTPDQQTATISLIFGLITSGVTLAAAGSGYAVNDLFTINESPAIGSRGVVDSLGAGGSIATFHISVPGTGYFSTGATLTSSAVTGVGTGATFNLTGLTIVGGTVALAGSGYGSTTSPNVTVTDTGGGTGAAMTCSLANTDNPINFTPAQAALLIALAGDLNNLAGTCEGTIQSTAGIGAINVHIGGGGSGYTVNDVLNINSGHGGTVKVTGAPGGAINGIVLLTAGNGYNTGTFGCTGGTGTGATFDVTTVVGVVNTTPPIGYNFLANLTAAAGVAF